MSSKPNVYLFGPFIGSLEYEFFRFSPYAIYLKKIDPLTKIIVLTRPERFDLYGQFANILIPLQVDSNKQQIDFKVDGFNIKKYRHYVEWFKEKYSIKYFIIDHFFPSIEDYRYKIKWQFPRLQMDYDFRPRQKNIDIVNKLNLKDQLLDLSWILDPEIKKLVKNELINEKYVFTDLEELVLEIQDQVDNINTTILGCIIEVIRKTSRIIGNLSSPLSHLGIVMKKHLITINESYDYDTIKLLNPFHTAITYKKLILPSN